MAILLTTIVKGHFIKGQSQEKKVPLRRCEHNDGVFFDVVVHRLRWPPMRHP